MTEQEYEERLVSLRAFRDSLKEIHPETASYWDGAINELKALRPLLVSAGQSDDHAAEGDA